MTEKLFRLVSWYPLPVVVHNDLGHPLREILELELYRRGASVGVDAVPNQLGKRVHGLGAGLPRHEVLFDLDLNVLNRSHSRSRIGDRTAYANEQKGNLNASIGPPLGGDQRRVIGRPMQIHCCTTDVEAPLLAHTR